MSEQQRAQQQGRVSQAIDPPGARGVPGAEAPKDDDKDWLYGGPAIPPNPPPAPAEKVGRQNRLTGEVQWIEVHKPKEGEAPKTPREHFAGT